MQSSEACVEYAHVYLNELVEGADPPTLDTVERELDKFSDATKLVIVDDTNSSPGIPRDDTFVTRRKELTYSFVADLTIAPDVVLYESDFTSCIEELLREIPEVEADELTPELDIGKYYRNGKDGLYVYGGDGEAIDKVRITDDREGAKVTGYTCGAYDAAITLAKLGEVMPPTPDIRAEQAVTFHPESYLESVPFERSATFRRLLRQSGIVDHDPTSVVNLSLTVSEIETAIGGN